MCHSCSIRLGQESGLTPQLQMCIVAGTGGTIQWHWVFWGILYILTWLILQELCVTSYIRLYMTPWNSERYWMMLLVSEEKWHLAGSVLTHFCFQMAIRSTLFLLTQQKRAHKKISIDPLSFSGGEKSKGPGDHLNNSWVQYCSETRPLTAEEWDTPRFIHKPFHGFYCWAKWVINPVCWPLRCCTVLYSTSVSFRLCMMCTMNFGSGIQGISNKEIGKTFLLASMNYIITSIPIFDTVNAEYLAENTK